MSVKMNVILDISKFSTEFLFFLEKKQNIVFDGIFTKIVYSNELFLMNGVYFQFPIKFMKMNENINKIYLSYHIYTKGNLEIVQSFMNLEFMILEQYKKMNNCNKKINNTLSKQLNSGNVKIFNSYRRPTEDMSAVSVNGHACFIMKISGVWETNDEVGITYKIYKC